MTFKPGARVIAYDPAMGMDKPAPGVVESVSHGDVYRVLLDAPIPDTSKREWPFYAHELKPEVAGAARRGLTYGTLEALAYTLTWLERESEAPDGYSIQNVTLVNDETGECLDVERRDGELMLAGVRPKPSVTGPITFHTYRPSYF